MAAEGAGAHAPELVQRTLDSIYGVDINPYAIAIARFRLLLAAMVFCGIKRLDKNVPGFHIHLAVGDSLLHAPLQGGQLAPTLNFRAAMTNAEQTVYQSEDTASPKQMLRGNQYHAVVANPPYITPKDRQLNERYRQRFKTCHMKYSRCPSRFLEKIFGSCCLWGYTGADPQPTLL